MKKVLIIAVAVVMVVIAFLMFISVKHYDREGIRYYLPYTNDKTEFSYGFFGDSIQYKEYRYDFNEAEKIIGNKFLKTVSSEDVVTIERYFADFEKWKQHIDFEGYNFDKSQIQQGDCFFLYVPENRQTKDTKYFDYDVWYFDVDKCILYYIHSNI